MVCLVGETRSTNLHQVAGGWVVNYLQLLADTINEMWS